MQWCLLECNIISFVPFFVKNNTMLMPSKKINQEKKHLPCPYLTLIMTHL